ncbi:hypothetical protein DN051_31435 [Streptomyces cadmiisoli]|uniref:Chitin-binding type-3 domain-containing protein n=1 Tax=Streptomyces cadmiisoli TaxID=2184053 RepID=A0A2Z4J5Y6_9ACTN|nr:hypothetical protein DN051_31435 [Streptomyces cadmiisoli]
MPGGTEFRSGHDDSAPGDAKDRAGPRTSVVTVTPTASDGTGQCTAPARTVTAEHGGRRSRVARRGHSWKAEWWTRGREPGATGEWGPSGTGHPQTP